ncbi:MAG: hypothetical protein C0P77_012645 [Thermoanaerobacterales bacterium]|nr:hypothetical protein [Thermoanaerobacterales bacterium]
MTFDRPDLDAALAAHLGLQVAGGGPPCGCWATATVPASPPWTAAAGPAGDAEGPTVPTAAILAAVDATARRVAWAALGEPGDAATLVETAASVQFHRAARGVVTARASVPCDNPISHRADASGTVRFSVAVDVTDAGGDRVATGSVQWLAQLPVGADDGAGAAGPQA